MRSTLVAGTALGGSLLISTFIWGSAQGASAPDLKGALGNNSSEVTLVAKGGGGGGGGGGRMSGGGGGGGGGGDGGGRGGHVSGGGGGDGGGGRAHISGVGSGGHLKSMSGGDGHFKSGGDGHFKSGSGPRNYPKRNFDNGPSVKGRDKFAGNNWKNGKNVHDHDRKHVAARDHDHDKNHFNRQRVFRNGVWVWVYGSDYYAGDDCLWLLRRAQTTGSGYWWSRYNACVGYY